MSTSHTSEAKFFDLHTTGIGYLNRIREVKPRGKGKPFMAVAIAALHGSTDEVEYSYIDCNVVGTEAEKLIRRCQVAVDAGKKVLASFRVGDIWVSRGACFLSAGSKSMAKPSMKPNRKTLLNQTTPRTTRFATHIILMRHCVSLHD